MNEAYIAQIRGDQPTRIILDAYPSASFEGSVRQIVPTANRQRATVQVKVRFLHTDSRVLPEMGARVEFLESSDPDPEAESQPMRLFVPAEAVRTVRGEAIVWVVRNGTVSLTTVDAGPVSGGRREVRAGLSGGEQVVIDPPRNLEDGARVNVVPTS